jgi:hypothetical protein
MTFRAIQLSLVTAAAVVMGASVAAAQDKKWEIEVHAGGFSVGGSTDAVTAMPPPGESFTLLNGRPSRRVSSWYFGDGAALANEWAAAFTVVPRMLRITPLDPVLNGSATTYPTSGGAGFRIGRRLTTRITAEMSLDYRHSRLELSRDAIRDIEAARSTFATFWNEELAVPGSGFLNATVSSVSEIEPSTGGEILATGALTVKLTRRRLAPFVTGGLGGAFNQGRAPTVTLKGNSSFNFLATGAVQVPAGTVVSFAEADIVVLRFVRPERTFVGLVGGGLSYDLSRRSGLRIDLRLHVRPNAVDTVVSATPAASGAPAFTLGSATTPSVVFSTSGATGTFNGPAIDGFKTRASSGAQFDTAIAVGYFWRF